jgi:hypothetical protein
VKNFWIYNGELEATPGSSIEPTIAEAIQLAGTVEYRPVVTFDFNGVSVTVAADSKPDVIYRDWHRALMGCIGKRVGPHPAADLTADELASDARIHADRDERHRVEQAQWAKDAEDKARRVAERLELAGAMRFSDESKWKSWVDANANGYGRAVVVYADQWARLMQLDMANGCTLSDIAQSASHEADTEGITGFMYGCAVSMLAECWERGEELRRWHNLSTQIGSEGEKANESGGVLNPALLSIG